MTGFEKMFTAAAMTRGEWQPDPDGGRWEPQAKDKKKCPFCGGAMYRVALSRSDPPDRIMYECIMCRFLASFRFVGVNFKKQTEDHGLSATFGDMD